MAEGAKEIALIRLLTRLMFVWFVKEKLASSPRHCSMGLR